ncbi:S1C family serine protease [Paenibacillus sp. NPDC058071]|uniref:S1C family serine protease n=1 Tax=Paenibacillus sp. NPDC058071 TaxID=3346326 RepID=UPI0036DA7B6B
MDDQNKKNGFDDFFRDGDEGNRHTDSEPSDSVREDNAADASAPEEQSKPSYYYSYGPFKPGAQEEGAYRSSSPGNEYGKPQESQPQPQPTSPYQAAGNDEPYNPYQTGGVSQEPSPPRSEGASQPQQQQQQLRPIVTSKQSARSGWQVREPRRRTSFRAMFLSFLAGVVVVGGLMYTADTRNWFTQGAAAPASQQSAGTSTGTTGTGGNGGASMAAAKPDNIASLFETASPAVVKIETFVNASSRSGGSILDDPFFRQFFGDNYPGTKSESNKDSGKMQPSGIGTGFFFDKTGYILTNQHVVGNSDKIEVTVQGYDKPFTAELLGSSYELDLAVLKVTGTKDFPTLPLGDSDNINIGDWVVAIGNPYGFDHTVTVGVLSAKERPIDIQDQQGTRNYEHLLQTDASINPGNSGGPLLNVKGEVIGINTAVSSQAQGIGFAIPTSTIQSVLDTLKNNKEVPKAPLPFIGAELTDVTEAVAKQLGIEKAEGSIVSNVYYNSPAYLGDLKQYDVILGIDGKKYDSTQALIKGIQSHKVGDKIELNVIRKGQAVNLQIEIGDKNKFNAE